MAIFEYPLLALSAVLLAVPLTIGTRRLCRILGDLVFQLFWTWVSLWISMFWINVGIWIWIFLCVQLAHAANIDLTPGSAVSYHYRSGSGFQVLILLRNL